MIYQQRSFDDELETSYKQNKIAPLFARLLAQRNIDNVDDFLNPPLDSYLHLKNMQLIRNVRDVSNLLMDAHRNKLSVGVISDYDTDGIVSSYMIRRLCDILNIECHVFLPSRFEHGYGLNEQTLASFLAFTITNKTPDLLFILDCGSSSEKEINKLKSFNIPTIAVIDHHILKADQFSKSANVVVNWRMFENAQEMCSCGLAYLVALDLFLTYQALDQNQIKEFLCLAAIGTIADVSPIIGDNRIIVKMGLSFFNHISSKGLLTLIKLCKFKESTITQQQVGFRLAPRLNAVGRLGSPQEAFDLLVSTDEEEIDAIIGILEVTNKQRRQIQGEILEEAIKMVESKKLREYGIFLVNPNWNIGVVGVVASELAEKYHKPTVVIGKEGIIWKGSGRSIKGVSLIKILDLCSEMFEKYGGHDFAAGVTLKKIFVDKASRIFNDACQRILLDENKNCDKKLLYDAVLNLSSVNEDTCSLVSKLYPYCETNNPEPIFKLSGIVVSFVKENEGENWKLFTYKVDGVNFEFKTFDEEIGNCMKYAKKMNLYFRFPQSYNQRWGMSLDVVGVEVLEV